MIREQTERKICAVICQSNGLKAKDIARQLNLDRSDSVLPVCSGDMLFNVFDEYLGFLSDEM